MFVIGSSHNDNLKGRNFGNYKHAMPKNQEKSYFCQIWLEGNEY